MNKTKLYIYSVLAASVMLNIGCSPTVTSAFDSAKNMLPTGSKSINSNALYAQVDEADKARVNDLNHDLKITEKTREISKLEERRDNLQQDRSKTNREMLEQLSREKTLRVELAKLEAIDKNKLGVRIDNIEAITDVHVDAIDIQQKRLKLQSEVAILDIKINEIDEQINKLKQELDNMSKQTTITVTLK